MLAAKKIIFRLMVFLLGFILAIFAYAMSNPDTAVCSLIKLMPVEEINHGALIEGSMSQNQRLALSELIPQAKARIRDSFGAPLGRPIIAFFNDPQYFWPLKINPYGSAVSLPGRTCVIIGPQGQNIDVLAHELVHAEVFQRLGWWKSFTELPVWFNEGLAMQVDRRSQYLLLSSDNHDTQAVRKLVNRDFFSPDDNVLTWRYKAAKAEVSAWINKAGYDEVYPLLERIQTGESFDELIKW